MPIARTNPLRPMSPYGIKTLITRAFYNEGAGKGNMFATSVATALVMKQKFGEQKAITIGNVNAFRD